LEGNDMWDLGARSHGEVGLAFGTVLITLISSEKIEEVMADIQTKITMEEFTTKDKENYYSGITSIMVYGKRAYELKVTKAIRDPNNFTFEKWLASKFANHMIMDLFTKKVLWDFWIKNNGQEGVANKEFSHAEKANNDYEQEMAEIFKIVTKLFDFKTPLCTEFKEFNFLLKVDLKLFTHNIEIIKTYEDYENKLNNELEEPLSKDGVPYEICDRIANLSVSKMGKLNGPLAIQMKTDSITEESYRE
nr:hypothetical protein [Tanacetum cinerariifolium]